MTATSVGRVGPPPSSRRAGSPVWAVIAPVALLASAAFATFPVRTEVLGLQIDCGASVLAGRMAGEGVLHVRTTLACHQAADPWRMAALAAGTVSVAAGAATTVGLRRRASDPQAVTARR